MNPSERLELIRSRFSRVTAQATRPAGLHLSAHPEAKQSKRKKRGAWRDGRKGFTIHARYTGNEREIGQGAEWVHEPVKVPERPLAPKRTKKVSPLTRIAERLPAKLLLARKAE